MGEVKMLSAGEDLEISWRRGGSVQWAVFSIQSPTFLPFILDPHELDPPRTNKFQWLSTAHSLPEEIETINVSVLFYDLFTFVEIDVILRWMWSMSLEISYWSTDQLYNKIYKIKQSSTLQGVTYPPYPIVVFLDSRWDRFFLFFSLGNTCIGIDHRLRNWLFSKVQGSFKTRSSCLLYCIIYNHGFNLIHRKKEKTTNNINSFIIHIKMNHPLVLIELKLSVGRGGGHLNWGLYKNALNSASTVLRYSVLNSVIVSSRNRYWWRWNYIDTGSTLDRIFYR